MTVPTIVAGWVHPLLGAARSVLHQAVRVHPGRSQVPAYLGPAALPEDRFTV